jgi:hypothetical protein
MSILKKRNILKLAATFMLVAMMAGAFAMHTQAAFAAIPCSNTTSITGDTTPGGTTGDNCFMTVSPDIAGLAFVSDPTVSIEGPVIVGVNLFNFTTIVTDTRSSTAGWQLQAVSSGLTGPAPVTLQIDGSDAVSPLVATSSSCGAAETCGVQSYTTQSLSVTPKTIVETTTSTAINGVLTISGSGSYNIPAGTPPGFFSGVITLSLLSTP